MYPLKPSQKYVKVLVLNKWNAFDQEGHYRISVTLDMPIKVGEPDPPFATAKQSDHQQEEASFELPVFPRDEAALKNRCEALLQIVRKREHGNRVAPFVQQLSHIIDPIAIPYIAKLAENMEETSAINGLMRIGTDEAMEAMILVTQSQYDKRSADGARIILRSKLPQIKDPIIRAKIEAAVK